MSKSISENKGFTIVEILVCLVLGSLLIACLFRTVISQQKIYTVQDQVVDAQQNIRVAIERMNQDVSMAGFGNPTRVLGLTGGVNGFTGVVTPTSNRVTIVGAFEQIRFTDGTPVLVSSVAGNTITLNHPTGEFDGAANKFISMGGMESFIVQNQPTGTTTTLTLDQTPTNPVGKCIYKIKAISYDLGVEGGNSVLRVDDNTGGGPQVLAENITSLTFKYFDGSSPPVETAVPANIRMIQVNVTGRTAMADPDYKSNGGYRTRQAEFRIYLPNLGGTT